MSLHKPLSAILPLLSFPLSAIHRCKQLQQIPLPHSMVLPFIQIPCLSHLLILLRQTLLLSSPIQREVTGERGADQSEKRDERDKNDDEVEGIRILTMAMAVTGAMSMEVILAIAVAVEAVGDGDHLTTVLTIAITGEAEVEVERGEDKLGDR
jgi:hypothetical protein